MPWQKKSSAPSTINVGDAFTALVTGDATWGWLINWIPLLPPDTIQTADLCALGPSTAPGLTLGDFTAPMGLDAGEILAHQIELANKLRVTVYDRLFGAYCELVTLDPAGVGCVSMPFNHDVLLAIPTGVTTLKFTSPGAPAIYGRNRYHFEQRDASGGASLPDLGYFDFNQAVGTNHTFTLAAGARFWDCGSEGAPVIPLDVLGCGPGVGGGSPTTSGHTATAQPQPVGVLAPTTRSYPDIASLGAELDRQELKLETILSILTVSAQRTVVGPTIADPPVAATSGPVIQAGAIGFRIDLANIPPGTDEKFGIPLKYHRLGRVTLGSANGWLPAIDLSQNPMLVAPLPPGVDRIQVACNPPATATITALRSK